MGLRCHVVIPARYQSVRLPGKPLVDVCGLPMVVRTARRALLAQPLDVIVATDDHHRFNGSELEFDNDWPIVCTEKDAVKISCLRQVPDNCWYLEIDVELSSGSDERLMALLREHGLGR